MWDAGTAEWACASMVSFCSSSSCINLLGSAGACAVLTLTLKEHSGSEMIVRLACEVVNLLCKDSSNRAKFGASGMCEALAMVLSFHAGNANVCIQVCRAACMLIKESSNSNGEILAHSSLPQSLSSILATHSYNVMACRWACSAIDALVDGNVGVQEVFGSNGAVESLVGVLQKHKSQIVNVEEALGAIRRLVYRNASIATQFSEAGVIAAIFAVLSQHSEEALIVEGCAWVIGHCTTIADTDFYNAASFWERLEEAVKKHASRDGTVRWLCYALGKFAFFSKDSSRPSTCDLIMTMLQRHFNSPSLVSKVGFAFGNLAANAENQKHLGEIGAMEAVATCVIQYVDKHTVKEGLFRAVTGLAQRCPENQRKFNAVAGACSAMIKSLYEDIEYEEVTLWGCRAVAALARDNKLNTANLGKVSNFLDEILREYKRNSDMVKTVFEVVAIIAHCNTANRSLLGVSGVCDEVAAALPQFTSKEDVDSTIIAVRVSTVHLQIK